MKVIHLITEVDEVSAAFRIHEAVKLMGVDSSFLALKRTSNNTDIEEVQRNEITTTVNKYLKLVDDEILKYIYPRRENVGFSSALATGYKISNSNEIQTADIIHIHWINAGFLSLKEIRNLIKLNKPIIWTLHDKWLLTGGCHVGCNKFVSGCGKCEILRSSCSKDYSYYTIKKKQKYLRKNNFILVAPSKWMLKNIRESYLFSSNNCINIPNTLNTNIFKKLNSKYVKNMTGYIKNENKFNILFGADSLSVEYKGFRYFEKMLDLLIDNCALLKDIIVIHLVGGGEWDNLILKEFETKIWGFVKDQEIMACIYNIADVYVHSSVSDNFPGMILESMSCEIPVVAFDVDGVPDLIEHKKEGYLAKKSDPISLLEGLMWTYERRFSNIGENGREKVVKYFAPEKVGKKYVDIYREMIEVE